ncbi:Ribosomal-protein-alanine N-acetyltransferase [Bacillus spizizenii]|nr:putative ribosomal-protein-alanine acetyltransferase [Bacillus spizizenii]SPT97409.1 ribosomal-protein-alanine N-acetyltransferase [Bacillus spizizenii]
MLKGNTIYVRPLEVKDAEENLRLQSENQDFFEQFSMIRADDYYTIEGQRKRIREYQQRLEKDEEYHFGIFAASDDTLIGTVSLFQIIRGRCKLRSSGIF